MDESLFAAFAAVEDRHWWFRARRDIVLAVADRVVPEGAAVLDLGCGTGFVLERLRERYDACGLDASPIALGLCRARGLERVWLGTPEDLSAVAGRRFRALFLLDVLEHLDDDAGALRRLRDILEPGGRVIVTVPAVRILWSPHDELNGHRRRYTRRSLGAALGDAGYAVERVSHFNAWLFPLALAARLVARAVGPRAPAGLAVPPEPLNRLLLGIFRSERRIVARASSRRGFPVGVSLLAVGRREDR